VLRVARVAREITRAKPKLANAVGLLSVLLCICGAVLCCTAPSYHRVIVDCTAEKLSSLS